MLKRKGASSVGRGMGFGAGQVGEGSGCEMVGRWVGGRWAGGVVSDAWGGCGGIGVGGGR